VFVVKVLKPVFLKEPGALGSLPKQQNAIYSALAYCACGYYSTKGNIWQVHFGGLPLAFFEMERFEYQMIENFFLNK
jgi:hypothetical protein